MFVCVVGRGEGGSRRERGGGQRARLLFAMKRSLVGRTLSVGESERKRNRGKRKRQKAEMF